MDMKDGTEDCRLIQLCPYYLQEVSVFAVQKTLEHAVHPWGILRQKSAAKVWEALLHDGVAGVDGQA